MQRSCPEESNGLRRLDASITPPDAAPAPIIVWISSMNKIDFSCSTSSAIKLFKRFSKSPRYFVPAKSDPMSKENTVLPSIGSGTFSSTISLAKPSAMAVFPTPDSPTNNGLFLRLRMRIWLTLSISASRPIRGSINPKRACSFRSVVNWLRKLCSAGSSD